jgi:predicted nucleic acid-binding protein
MKKLKLYIDTSVIGYLDEQTSPKEMADALALWKMIKRGDYEVVLSRITLDEIYDNKNLEKVSTLARFLAEISYETLELDDDIRRIADLVKSNGVLVSDKHQNDRLHIGCAVVCCADILVSLNFKHLVNVKTVKGVRGIAISEGYGYIEIMPPVMLTEGGEL